MKRLALTALLLIAAFFAGRMLYVGLAGDETRIRWLLQEEAESFNGCAMLGILDSFADDYREETVGLGRDELRAGLRYAFQSKRDPASRRFLYRVELPAEDLAIDLQDDRAVAVFPLRLYEGLDAAERMAWEIRVTADLERREQGWKVVRSRHETVAGTRPGGR